MFSPHQKSAWRSDPRGPVAAASSSYPTECSFVPPPGIRVGFSIEVIRAMFCSGVYVCCVDCEFTEVLFAPPRTGWDQHANSYFKTMATERSATTRLDDSLSLSRVGSACCHWSGCGPQCNHPARQDAPAAQGLAGRSGRRARAPSPPEDNPRCYYESAIHEMRRQNRTTHSGLRVVFDRLAPPPTRR